MKGIETQFSIGLRTKDGDNLVRHAVITDTIAPTLGAFDLKGFTVLDGVGYWEGKPEPTLLVSVITEGPIEKADASGSLYRAETLATKIARVLAIELRQECVLYSIRPVVYGFVPSEEV